MTQITPNADMVEYWNKAAGPKWVTEQARVDRHLAPLSERALARAAAQPGEWVLDVGCGCGTTTLALAQAVGETGHATAVDLSRPMLEHARRRAQEAGLAKRIDWHCGDAQVLDLGAGRHDLVFSRFGVMFFENPEAAFRNLARATRPGGRICFLCWQSREANPWLTVPARAAAALLEFPSPPDPEAPGPFAFGDPERVKRILAAAGYRDVETEAVNEPLLLGNGNLDEATEFALEIGPVAGALHEAGNAPALRARVRETVAAALRGFEGLRAPAGAWIVTATRAVERAATAA